jgi:hypothetical protein
MLATCAGLRWDGQEGHVLADATQHILCVAWQVIMSLMSLSPFTDPCSVALPCCCALSLCLQARS